MNAAQLINQTSGVDEYYTPVVIIEAARLVLGEFDLDPASSAVANQTVKAKRFFDKDQDGLKQRWIGRVWMNHPFGRKLNGLWIGKLNWEVLQGTVTEALCITYACTSEKWFRPLLNRPQCFLIPRTDYYLPSGEKKRGVTKGSVVTYFGRRVETFQAHFKSLGVVKIPYL